MVPLIKHEYRYEKGMRIGVITYNSLLGEKMAEQDSFALMSPRFLPMLVPPKRWMSWNSGGYLTHNGISFLDVAKFTLKYIYKVQSSQKGPCLRVKGNPDQKRYLAAAFASNRIRLVLAGLDVLGSTKWRVNEDMYEVIKAAWNTGVEWPSIPPLNRNLPEPEKPQSDPPLERSSELMRGYRAAKRVRDTQIANDHSQRCDTNYKLEIAHAVIFFF